MTVVALDPWDELFHSINSQYKGAGAGAAVVFVKGCVEPEVLAAALARLQQRHPKLRARIVATPDGRHAFEVLPAPPPIPFSITDYSRGDLPWKEESQRLLAATIDATTDLLARVVVLRSPSRERSVLLVMAHHALGDGASVLRLVGDLFDCYGAVESRDAAPRETLSIPATPRATPVGSPWKRFVQAARLVRHRRENRKGNWIELPHAEKAPRGPLCDHFVLSEADTTTLAARCRKEKSTLYGALFAAAAGGIVAALEQPAARLKCRFPLDVRHALVTASGSITHDDLGNYMSGYEATFHVDSREEFWTRARQARGGVERFIADGGPSLVYNFIRFVKLPYVPPTLRRTTILVNSYGVVGLRNRYGSLSPEEMSVIFNNVSGGPSVLIQGFIVRKRLNVSVSMADVPQSFWDRVRSAVVLELEEALRA